MLKPILILATIFAAVLSQPIPDDKLEESAHTPLKAPNKLEDQTFKPTDKPAEKSEKPIEVQKDQLVTGTLTLGQVIDRIGDAMKLTYQEEKISVANMINALKIAAGQSLKATVTGAQTGLDMILIFPKLGKNILLTTSPPRP